MKITKNTTLIMAAFLMAGCAGVTVKPITDEAHDRTDRGVRYYESANYLLIYPDNKGGIISKIISMPDLSRKMSAKPYNFLASSEFILDFSNGVLTGSKSTIDETVVPKAVVTALEKAAATAVKFAAANAPGKDFIEVPQPYLYKIIIDPDSVSLVGERDMGPDCQVKTIKVSTKPE